MSFRIPVGLAVLALVACGRPEPLPTATSSTESPPEAGPVTGLPASGPSAYTLPPPLPRVDEARWSAPVPVHAFTGRSEAPALTALGGGRTLAVWTQTLNAAPYQRLYSAVRSANGWSTPLELSNSGPGSDVSLSSPGDGTAIAAWLEYAGTSTRQLVVRTWVQSAWSAPVVLASFTWQQGNLMQPVARLGADGLAVVAWAVRAPTADTYTLFSAARPRGGSWTTGTALAGAFVLGRNSEAGAQLDLAIDGSGGVLVVWAQVVSGTVEIWSRRGQASAGSVGPISWSPELRVATEPGAANGPVFGLWAGHHAGRFFTGWLRKTATATWDFVTRHERPEGLWDAEAEAGDIRWSQYAAPRFAAAANGDKVLVWRESDTTASRIVARTFDGATGWGPRVLVADGLAPPYLGCIDIDAHFHDVAIDAEGHAVAVWEERTPPTGNDRGSMHVRSSRFVPGAGWSMPTQLDENTVRATRPAILVSGATDAVALFAAEAPSGAPPLQSTALRADEN
jgi:hypothetical protein